MLVPILARAHTPALTLAPQLRTAQLSLPICAVPYTPQATFLYNSLIPNTHTKSQNNLAHSPAPIPVLALTPTPTLAPQLRIAQLSLPICAVPYTLQATFLHKSLVVNAEKFPRFFLRNPPNLAVSMCYPIWSFVLMRWSINESVL